MNLSAISPSRWLSTAMPVDRTSYLATGAVLMVVKYALEAIIVGAMCRVFWPPWVFLSPFVVSRAAALGPPSDESRIVLVVLAILSLPFLAIGLSMSVRRAADAGLSPWIGLAFAVPGLNYLTMLVLAIMPSNPQRAVKQPSSTPASEGAVRAATLGVFTSTCIGVGVALIASDWLGLYGAAIFFVLPIWMGATAGYVVNREVDRGMALTLQTALAVTMVTAGALLLSAIEGALCVLMAAPIALVAVPLGAVIGRDIANLSQVTNGGPGGSGAGQVLTCIALLPALALVESAAVPASVYEVSSSVEVRASPEEVWKHVISFPEIPPAEEWYFHTGIAVPMRARVDGEGVGAVRHCEFSTGSFVEPITVWEPGRRLGFDVASQPPPMEEWSPYRNLHPPHLDASLRSVRGEFRLIAMPDGRTRLEGSTWYSLALGPELYFRVWSDAIIHRIHLRVLDHVRILAEGD